jgi:hypothetical protein
MSSLVFVAPVVFLALCLVPALLLRRKTYPRAQDYFVSSNHTPPGVIQNSSIAYVLKLSIFGPLFAWGASGDFWPAIASSTFLGLGLYLIYVLRRPMLGFLGDALSRDRSFTMNEFVARRHGNDPRVRLLASGLTIFALAGLIVCEMIGLATILKPLLSDHAGLYGLSVTGALALTVLYTMPSGNSGVMYAAQMQLGVLYLGLFGAATFLLYLQVSELRPMPPHATLAIVFAAVFCAVIPIYRRSRYVDNNLITKPELDVDGSRDPSGAKPLRGFQRILNVCITVFAVLVVVIALMQFSSQGLTVILRDSTMALLAGTRVPGLGLVSLVLLPAFHPIVDMTNWQRIAAFEKDRDAGLDEASEWSAAFKRFCVIYAAESPLAWLFMCAFGAIVVVSMTAPEGTDVMQAFLAQVISQQNSVAEIALSLLLVGVLAMALSTMISLFSASLCTLRYDVLPNVWPEPEPAPGEVRASDEAKATRRTVAAGAALCLAILAAFYFFAEYLQITFTGGKFLALVFAFSCAQLSFVPLVLGPLIGRTREGSGAVSPPWALGILGLGTAVGVGAAAAYLATGHEPWLWAAIPACLAAGALLFGVARLQSAAEA